MPRIKVIGRRYLPMPSPLTLTAVVWLLLDRLRPAWWFCVTAWTLMTLLWLIHTASEFLVERVAPGEFCPRND